VGLVFKEGTSMRVLKHAGTIVGLLGGVSILSACPAVLDDRCAENACVPFDAGADGDGGVDVPDAQKPADCNETADAVSADAKGCVVDSFALFVDGSAGDDANDGSKARPLKTIGAAIAKVGSTGKRRIYVCGSATYAEHLSMTTAVNLYGGFACTTWEPDRNAKAKVAPTDKGYALHIDTVSAAVVVSDLELFAADAGDLEDGTSSIAVFANKTNVTFLRAVIHASNGAKGAAGPAGAPGKISKVSSGSADATGNPGSGANGGARKECTCDSSSDLTVGGAGGPGGLGGGNGEPNYNAAAPDNGAPGLPAVGGNCDANSSGHRGADAPPARDATPPTTQGTLDATGWHPTRGADATENGKPGQGGGGGGALNASTGGSGGGCGGCGGFAGKGSGGGGASVAVLANESTVTLNASTLETRAGGEGGLAGAGGLGAEGGSTAAAGACLGGKGGNGANGGAGAGGAGGVSIGVLYKGTAPVIDAATTISVGSPGAGGKGGKSPGNDGPIGVAEKTKDATQL